MSNDKHVPGRVGRGVPTGGQFAASAKDEAAVRLGDSPAPVRRCSFCRKPLADDSCVNPSCLDFDMANPEGRFEDVPIRAHSLQPGDTLPDGAKVVEVTMDPSGRRGRQAHVRTDAGDLPPLGINDFLTVTRSGPEE